MPLRSEEREILSVLLPFVLQYAPHFVLQYASHSYRSYFWENLGGCGHRDVPQVSRIGPLRLRHLCPEQAQI